MIPCIIHLDLDSGRAKAMDAGVDADTGFPGGKGLALQALGAVENSSWNAPEAVVAVMAGALAGTMFPMACFASMAAVSPVTGRVMTTELGGRFGSCLAKSGFAGLTVRGRANTPVGIRIGHYGVKIEDADGLWTKNNFDTAVLVPGQDSILSIGPGGENLSPMAGVVLDGRLNAGRGGIGACLGAKNIKYIAIDPGESASVAHRGKLAQVRKNVLRLTRASSVLTGPLGFSGYSTAALVDLAQSRSMLPTDNFSKTAFVHEQDIGPYQLKKKFAKTGWGCKGCHVRCLMVSRSGHVLPDCDSLAGFTALIGNKDLGLAIKAHEQCLALGLDPVQAAAVFAGMLARDKKLKPAALLEVLDDFSKAGPDSPPPAPPYAVKNLALPGLDPRGAMGLALAYALTPSGPDYRQAMPISYEILRKPVALDRFSFSAKARAVKTSEDVLAAASCLGVCPFFVLGGGGLQEMALGFTAITGRDMDAGTLARIGERACYLERMLNHCLGWDGVGDNLPDVFFTAPGTDGDSFQVPPVDRDKFMAARSGYYRIRGLDQHGAPTMDKAAELGVSCGN